MFELHERLHEIAIVLNQTATQAESLEKVLVDTPWQNRASLIRELRQVERELRQMEAQPSLAKVPPHHTSRIESLRKEVLSLDRRLADRTNDKSKEDEATEQLRRLTTQLELQSRRLTRAIVADSYLADFDFLICPRCGAAIDSERGSDTTCCLCLQPPAPPLERRVLVEEQDRIEAQVIETRQLIASRWERAKSLASQIAPLIERREQLSR
jgi:hypothetical protein